MYVQNTTKMIVIIKTIFHDAVLINFFFIKMFKKKKYLNYIQKLKWFEDFSKLMKHCRKE